MGNTLGPLYAESGVPGLSTVFNAKRKRKTIWGVVFSIFAVMTMVDLFKMLQDFASYPVTVSVKVADARVLPFPAVTVCNLNPVHRGRFCSDSSLRKPINITRILCADLEDLLQSCEVSQALENLLDKGRDLCGVKRSQERGSSNNSSSSINESGNEDGRGRNPRGFRRRVGRPTSETTTAAPDNSSIIPTSVTRAVFRRRGKRQISLPDMIRGFRDLMKNVGGTKGITNTMNDIQDAIRAFIEGGGPMDGMVTQIAGLFDIEINSTADLVPALFMRIFTEVTGCRLGNGGNGIPVHFKETLGNLTKLFSTGSCLMQAPKLLGEFGQTSQKMADALEKCTGPWLSSLSGKGETPWFVLLELLEAWLASLSQKNPQGAKRIGHYGKDLIKKCYFAGKRCDVDKEFTTFFYNSYGNCFTYNAQMSRDFNSSELAESGFTGPKFGLELTLNLETDQYMPTSREAGAKIVVHDRVTRADPDQDAVHVPPGLVTYVGVKLVNITRLGAPYPDKCSDYWKDAELAHWAQDLKYETYSSQICLKLCLQRFTIKHCGCWSPQSPSPPSTSPDNVDQCNTRTNETHSNCANGIRYMYYNGSITCNCPPRCSERSYEKFVSTGKELPQCSAISSGSDGEKNQKQQENYAKVVVYFETLQYQEIEQMRKYTPTELLGAIGGILGVYIGFSFLAIYEMVEVFIRGTICSKQSNYAQVEDESVSSAVSTGRGSPMDSFDEKELDQRNLRSNLRSYGKSREAADKGIFNTDQSGKIFSNRRRHKVF